MSISQLFKKIWSQRNLPTGLYKEETELKTEFVSVVEPSVSFSHQALETHKVPEIKNLYASYKELTGGTLNPSNTVHSIVAFAFANNKKMSLNLKTEHFDELFQHCAAQDKVWSAEVLTMLGATNKGEDINLRQDQIDYLVANTDVNKNTQRSAPLAGVFFGNINQNLNLTKQQIADIMVKTDFTQERYTPHSALNEALAFNTINQLDLTPQQWDYLIKNSKLSNFAEQKEAYPLPPHHCVLNMFASIAFKSTELTYDQKDYIFKDSQLDIYTIEALTTDQEKFNHIWKELGVAHDSYPEFYNENILKGYNEFKIEKLQHLAIEQENKSLKDKISARPWSPNLDAAEKPTLKI